MMRLLRSFSSSSCARAQRRARPGSVLRGAPSLDHGRGAAPRCTTKDRPGLAGARAALLAPAPAQCEAGAMQRRAAPGTEEGPGNDASGGRRRGNRWGGGRHCDRRCWRDNDSEGPAAMRWRAPGSTRRPAVWTTGAASLWPAACDGAGGGCARGGGERWRRRRDAMSPGSTREPVAPPADRLRCRARGSRPRADAPAAATPTARRRGRAAIARAPPRWWGSSHACSRCCRCVEPVAHRSLRAGAVQTGWMESRARVGLGPADVDTSVKAASTRRIYTRDRRSAGRARHELPSAGAQAAVDTATPARCDSLIAARLAQSTHVRSSRARKNYPAPALPARLCWIRTNSYCTKV